MRPVAARPADNTKTLATMIAGSLANPDSAWRPSRMPVSASASSTSIATRSMRNLPLMNITRAAARISRKMICSVAIDARNLWSRAPGWAGQA